MKSVDTATTRASADSADAATEAETDAAIEAFVALLEQVERRLGDGPHLPVPKVDTVAVPLIRRHPILPARFR